MSFNNTKSPNRGDIDPKKIKSQVEMRPGRHNILEYYFTPEQEAKFKEIYPVRTNQQVMQYFGIGYSTMKRHARIWGLVKDMKKIYHIQAQHGKRTCEKNGYYDSIRGKAPSQATLDGYQKYLHSGNAVHPFKLMKKKSPRRYNKFIQKLSDDRKKLLRTGAIRRKYGMESKTKFNDACVGLISSFTHNQAGYRYTMKRRGYILGDTDPKFGERYIIYYDEATERSMKVESNAQSHGFTILPLPQEEEPQQQDASEHAKVYREQSLANIML